MKCPIQLAAWLLRGSLLFVIFTLTASFTPSLSAQPLSQEPGGAKVESPAACSQAQYRMGVIPKQDEENEIYFGTPPNPDGPTLVDLGLFLDEISAINAVDEQFAIEGYLDLLWCDPREAFDPAEVGVTHKVYVEADAAAKLAEIWWPDIEIVNEIGGRSTKNQELIVAADGTLEYSERFSSVLENHFELLRFPFDRQQLEVEIESFAWDADFLIFHVETDKIGFSDKVEPVAWQIESVTTQMEIVQEIRDRAPFSEFLLTISVARRSGFYVWKVLAPLLLLVFIVWAVFWLGVDDLPSRLGVLFTGILSIVAYQFILTGGLPPVSYFILTDSLIGYSFLFMVLTVVENVYMSTLHSGGQEARAERLDRLCRWLFPASYAIGLVVIVALYLLP